jgi:manganese-dependent ADP-ribose/CDP-alcohol diphosphatase
MNCRRIFVYDFVYLFSISMNMPMASFKYIINKSVATLVVLLVAGFSLSSFAQKKDNPIFKFGVFADVQYADKDNLGSRHYRSSIGKLKEAMDVLGKEKVAFAFSLGDFVDADFNVSYDTLSKIVNNSPVHVHHVLGNHDFTVGEEEKHQVASKMGLKNNYYSVEKKGWRFIAVDGNEISVYANPANSENYRLATETMQALKKDKKPSSQYSGAMSAKQLAWLKSELQAAAKKKQKVVVLSHMPLQPATGVLNLWNAPELVALMEASPHVVAYFNGHAHEGGYHHQNGGIHYINFKGMVENESNAFAVVSVYADHLEVKGFGVEETRTLAR